MKKTMKYLSLAALLLLGSAMFNHLHADPPPPPPGVVTDRLATNPVAEQPLCVGA